jgi:RNA polymerase sigma-70 factor (ECF subfamily)
MDDKRDRFEAQVMPHLDAAYRFARWLARSAVEADDIVQEAFLRAFRAFDTLRGGEPKAWLFTIVRNCHATAVQQQRRRGEVGLAQEPAAPPGGEALAATPDPEEHREVLLLREMEDMSYREIAAVTQVPIGTVMSRLARARAALKLRWLQQAEGEPHAVR